MVRLSLHSVFVASVLLIVAGTGLTTSTHAAAAEGSTAKRPKVCLVLSGGGARGVAHVGVLKVLEQLRVPVDCVVGTSMGSIIGGSFAYGESPAAMERLIRKADWPEILLDQPQRADRSVHSKELDRASIGGAEFGVRGLKVELPTGAIIGQQLDIFLQQLAGPNEPLPTFDQLPIPFRAIATNIENGEMVVLEGGSLPASLRASMSVPGVFAPAEIDGMLLVDGGLARNLGVDVARKMGGEILIAVNLGTGLMKRDQIQSFLGVGMQMVHIYGEQNVRISLSELTDRDILIVPELGDFSSSDFEGSAKTIEIGERAARAVADRLRSLSVSEEEYAQFTAQVRGHKRRKDIEGLQLDTQDLARVNPRVVEATFNDATGGQFDPKSLGHGIKELLATDDFELVGYGVVDSASQRILEVEPTEKSWGPNYLHLGLTFSTDLQGESAFNLVVDHRMTWLTQHGLEWRNRVSLGDVTGLYSSLFQPLDLARKWFVSPSAVIAQDLFTVFAGDNAVAQYRNRRGEITLELGRRFGTIGEAGLGYGYGDVSFTKSTGSAVLPDSHDDLGSVYGRVVLDDYDNWNFPSKGYFVSAFASVSRQDLGADLDYNTGITRLEKAFGTEKNHYRVGVEYSTSFGSDRPIYNAFPLGGFLHLSGYSQREFLVDGALLGRVIYERRLASVPAIAKGLYLGGSLEAANLDDRLNGPQQDGVLYSGSVYFAADTILGPFYFAVGLADAGNAAVYLFLGRPL